MGIDVITMEDCASNYGIFTIKGSKGEDHYITFYGSEGAAHCTCDSFKYSGSKQSCKHIKKVWEKACMYNPQWKEAVENPELRPTGYTYDQFSGNKCLCGGPLVYVKRAV